jgi:two-component system phosphate regulon sensor histidine kinase PhoR
VRINSIRFIILFSSLALIGLVVTQTFWVSQALEVTRKHFEHRAQSALNSTIEEIKRATDTCKCVDQMESSPDAILYLVKPYVLDSLLTKYVGFYKLDRNYEFAIIKSSNDSIVYSTKGFYNNCSKEKIFKHCLSCIYNKQHFHVELMFPQLQKYLVLKVWGWLILSIVFLLIIILCFGFIVFAVFRTKKLSDMKTDFINNMTHEFKTPISTVSLASEILVNTNKDTNIEKIHRYAKIIYDENLRMRSQVDQVLRMAQLDQGDFDINKEDTDVHELLSSTINGLCLEHLGQPAKINFHLNAKKFNIMADPIHLGNIAKNLVENACKYSKENTIINIYTSSNSEGITLSFVDNGIGIDTEYHKYIFDKFYRIPTGNIHDVKGFGIGLYYVKKMVEAHSGKIIVKSELGKGCCFEIFIPFSNPKKTS